jgi:hypothetical protein
MPILFAKDAFLNLNVNKPIQMKIYTNECGVRTLTAKVETIVWLKVCRGGYFLLPNRE